MVLLASRKWIDNVGLSAKMFQMVQCHICPSEDGILVVFATWWFLAWGSDRNSASACAFCWSCSCLIFCCCSLFSFGHFHLWIFVRLEVSSSCMNNNMKNFLEIAWHHISFEPWQHSTGPTILQDTRKTSSIKHLSLRHAGGGMNFQWLYK